MTIDYLELVPSVIRDAVMALDKDKEWETFICLLEHKEMSYAELLNELGYDRWTLYSVIRTLGKGGLIAQYTTELKEIDNNSYYKPTSIGKDFIEVLMDAFLPYHAREKDQYKPAVVSKLYFEKAFDLEDSTIERVFNPTVGGKKLADHVKKMRDSGELTVQDISGKRQTTIAISKSTMERLKALKMHPGQSHNDVILDLINEFGGKSSGGGEPNSGGGGAKWDIISIDGVPVCKHGDTGTYEKQEDEV